MISLDVRNLRAIGAVTPGQLASRSEAASVMMWRFHAAPRTEGSWERDALSSQEGAIEVEILWDEPTRGLLEAHGDEIKNVERAAEAVAMVLADHLGFDVISEAHHRSGCDWVMVPKGEPPNDYYKLEVSGIIRKDAESPRKRLRAKLAQGRGGDWKRPGMAVVVRFEEVRILSEAWR